MYCAITPRIKIVIEKHKTIVATMLPKPANGTPRRIHEMVNPIKDIPEITDINTPKIETQAKGSEL
jgi:hypothetical protein